MNTQSKRIRVKYNRTKFKTIDEPDKAYWLGFFMADGYVLSTRDTSGIKLGALDGLEHLTKFANFLEADYPDLMVKTQTHSTTGNTIYTVHLYSKPIKEDLIRNGIMPNKSGKEDFPETLPKHLYRDFIRGIWDGDGWVRIDGSGIGLVGSQELLYKTQQHFKEVLGIEPKSIMQHGTIFKIEYRAQQDCHTILNYLYKDTDTYLTRKYDLFKKNF